MNANAPSTRLLLSLLTLGQQDETIDLFSVAEEAGLSLYQALKGLSALSDQGLVDARRLRLTLAGLAVTCGIEGAARAAGLEEAAGQTGPFAPARCDGSAWQGSPASVRPSAAGGAISARSLPGNRAA